MRPTTLHIALFCSLALIWAKKIHAQRLFHQDVFYGGVAAGGFSMQSNGVLPLYIEPGSSIRNAYLFVYCQGYSHGPILINGTSYAYDTLNCIMTVDYIGSGIWVNWNPIRLFYRDITADLNASMASTFNITLPWLTGGVDNTGPSSVFIYIEYENHSLPKTASSIWVNDLDLRGYEEYFMSGMNPINTAYPVGLSVMIDRAGSKKQDGTSVYVNNTKLGTIGGADAVNYKHPWGGTKGHFYYQNNTLFGLDDDTPDNTMDSTDALADISDLLQNGATSYSSVLDYEKLTEHGTNSNLFFFNAYSSPCDTFSTSISSNSIACRGDSIPLFASGGSRYQWFPSSGLSNPNAQNPLAAPDQTTLYVVRIESDSGCSRTEKIRVQVNQLPSIDSIRTNDVVCGEQNGSIHIQAQGTGPLQFALDSQWQADSSFYNLPAGFYSFTLVDSNGCTFDSSATLNEINHVKADFNANPISGVAPLLVDLNNQSFWANQFLWNIQGLPLSNNINESFSFDSAGVYSVQLIAWYNSNHCADTTSIDIVVYDSSIAIIPNVFSPNNDGSNDVFSIKVQGIKKISGYVFNRWGTQLHFFSSELAPNIESVDFWTGTTLTGETVSNGVYYYEIELTDSQGKPQTKTGTLHVFK